MSSDSYKNIALWYDLLSAWALKHLRSRVATLCHESGWRTVLDIGCGTGVQVAQLHMMGIHCYGLDASPAMLAIAQKRLPPEMPLVLGTLPLPFADNFFDASILSLVLHETDDEPEKLLHEALRVAPVCVVLEWRMPERNLELPKQIITHAVERLAGKRHYARFRAYTNGGWLRGLAAKADVSFASEESVLGGLMTLAVLSRRI